MSISSTSSFLLSLCLLLFSFFSLFKNTLKKLMLIFNLSFFKFLCFHLILYLFLFFPFSSSFLYGFNTLMVTCLDGLTKGITAWHALTLFPLQLTSHVPHSPFLQEYRILAFALCATSFIG